MKDVDQEAREQEIIENLNRKEQLLNTPMTHIDEIINYKTTDTTVSLAGSPWFTDTSLHVKADIEECTKVFEKSEGIKKVDNKYDYSEINLQVLDLMAERFSKNKAKYPKGNMLKPIDKSKLVWAAFRHIKKMLQPVGNDSETFEDHLAAVLCNMSMTLDQLNIKK